jgi:hypothetical protein
MDYAANLAHFLLGKTESVCGLWSGKLTASEQRELFGRVIGKGRIVIDGHNEIIFNRVRVCFGRDYDDRNITRWANL